MGSQEDEKFQRDLEMKKENTEQCKVSFKILCNGFSSIQNYESPGVVCMMI